MWNLKLYTRMKIIIIIIILIISLKVNLYKGKGIYASKTGSFTILFAQSAPRTFSPFPPKQDVKLIMANVTHQDVLHQPVI